MRDVNECYFTGNVAKKITYLEKNEDFRQSLRFFIGNHDKNETMFIPVIVYGASADYLHEHMHTGNLVHVSGRLSIGELDENGFLVHPTCVRAKQVKIIKS